MSVIKTSFQPVHGTPTYQPVRIRISFQLVRGTPNFRKYLKTTMSVFLTNRIGDCSIELFKLFMYPTTVNQSFSSISIALISSNSLKALSIILPSIMTSSLNQDKCLETNACRVGMFILLNFQSSAIRALNTLGSHFSNQSIYLRQA